MARIKYEDAPDVRETAEDIVRKMNWDYIDLDNVGFLRSFNSSSRGTIARCHAMGKAMQLGMKRNKSFYVIEVISKRFDKLSKEDQVKTIIHELMHIPKTFGGGFKHHDVVNEKNVERVYDKYEEIKKQSKWF